MGLPAFANGGTFGGGARLVGERGAEIEVTGASRIISNKEIINGMNGSGSNNKAMEDKMNFVLSKMLMLTEKMYRQQSDWTGGALNVRVIT